MTTKSLLHSSLLDNQYYTSMLVGNAGYDPTKAPGFDHLATYNVTSQITAINFTNLNSAYGSDYHSLQIRGVLNRTVTNGAAAAHIYFNGDTSGSSYWYHVLAGNGVNGSAYNSTNRADCIYYSGTGSDMSFVIIDIPLAFTNERRKTARVISGGMPASNEDNIQIASHLWNSTAIIDSIRISTGSKFDSPSRISLYGLKEAV